jgi:hypothetical protein
MAVGKNPSRADPVQAAPPPPPPPIYPLLLSMVMGWVSVMAGPPTVGGT